MLGHPKVLKGQSPDENHVSSTSWSCTSVNVAACAQIAGVGAHGHLSRGMPTHERTTRQQHILGREAPKHTLQALRVCRTAPLRAAGAQQCCAYVCPAPTTPCTHHLWVSGACFFVRFRLIARHHICVAVASGGCLGGGSVREHIPHRDAMAPPQLAANAPVLKGGTQAHTINSERRHTLRKWCGHTYPHAGME